MNTLAKATLLSVTILALSACEHMHGRYKSECSIPIQPIDGLPLSITIVNGVPTAKLGDKIISERVDLPDDFTLDPKNETRSVSIRSIEQFSLVKIKGSCYYYACSGSVCSKFEVPDAYCN